MGTPDFAVPSLEALHRSSHDILALVTAPDKPKGRGRRKQAPAAKQAAFRLGLPVLQPGRVDEPELLGQLSAMRPDAVIVVAFGQKLPRMLLGLPRQGCVNLHASLLPRHRGAAPVNWALIRGDTVTGLTTILMNEGIDTGDIILQRPVAIEAWDTAGSLGQRLAGEGAGLLMETLDRMEEGRAPRIPQDSAQATTAPKLTKQDGVLCWQGPAWELANRVRGVTPAPGAFAGIDGRLLRIWKARPLGSAAPSSVSQGRWGPTAASGGPSGPEAGSGGIGGEHPGEVLGVDRASGALVVCTGSGLLEVLEVQPESGGRMSGADFSNGYRVGPGSRFDREFRLD